MDDLSVSPPLSQSLGDYELSKLLEQGPLTRTFLAIQRSVNREVLLDQLREELATPEIIEGFFADVRAKAAIDHPLIGSVYEAVSRPDAHFFTHEKLAGRSLLELMETGVRMSPLEMARLLKRVADANLYLQARGICTAALAPDHVFVEDQGLTRMVNMALAGTRNERAYVADIQKLGHLLEDLIGTEMEGSTRVRTLLGWMADLQRSDPLTWEQILDYAEQVEQQLTAAAFTAQPAPTQQADGRRAKNLPVRVGGVAVALALITGAAWHLTRPGEPKVPGQRDLSAVVSVPAGSYPTPDESSVELGAFRIDAHEVSIGEYQKFLAELSILEEAAKNAFDHVDQPASKANHLPDGWDAMVAAATAGGPWKNAPIDLNFPVVRIDWWDAYAYARWKHGRVPTQNEWFAAASQGAANISQLRAAAWGPVDAESPDILPNGLHGMAGNVAEWTGENELNPSVPMTPRRPLVIGASHVQPAGGAKAREWVESRSVRRDDLGFRVVYDGAE